MSKTLIAEIANVVQARSTCKARGNQEWFARHTDRLIELGRMLPSGSGIDNGTSIDLDASRPDRIVLITAFHHMHESGMYAGWTDHTVVVRPDFVSGVDVTITGRNRNEIKDYLGELFSFALLETLPEPVQVAR